jgi:glycosyltransferase involved in cell wall biosynthesis
VVSAARRSYRAVVRVAVVSTPFVRVPPRGYGGTELVVHALVVALERLGHAVTLFATGDSRTKRVRALFTRAIWPPDPYAELLHCRAAVGEIAAGGFDVVHAHVPAMLAFVRDVPAPVVYTVHHAADEGLARFYEAAPAPAIRVAISARQAELARPRPAVVVHHGLDPAMYPRCGPGGDLAVFIGRISWTKGPDLAIAAARRARLPVVVCGSAHADPPSQPGWAEEVFAALRAPRVEWRRMVGLAAKRTLFARARALVAPHRWEEPFGLVIAEALLAGCPVIAAPRGSAPELVVPGVDGFLADGVGETAEALRAVAALDRRVIQARARRRFSAARMAQAYLAVYAAAQGGARAPSAAEETWNTLQG